MKINDSFGDLYNKIISESPYDSYSQSYWLGKSKETEQMRRNRELDIEEDEIELNGDEFEAHLRQGAYQADLEGTVEGNTIHWEVSDYNSDFDGPLGIEINGESEGTREIGEGQTAEMVLQNLYAEFKDAFAELDIKDVEGEGYEDDQNEYLDQDEYDIDEESVKPTEDKKVIKEDDDYKYADLTERWDIDYIRKVKDLIGFAANKNPSLPKKPSVVQMKKVLSDKTFDNLYVKSEKSKNVQDRNKMYERIAQLLVESVEPTKKKVIKEDAIREMSGNEFPEELRKSIEELIKIKEKVDKRWEENQELNKKVRGIGKLIDRFDKANEKKGIRVPIKYRNLVWDILEKLH